jgi:hypothetical protein
MFAVLDFMPFLSLLGFIALAGILGLIVFWSRLETPLIWFLIDVRAWRDERRRRRSYWKARGKL